MTGITASVADDVEVHQMSATIGAVISGVDLAADLSESTHRFVAPGVTRLEGPLLSQSGHHH